MFDVSEEYHLADTHCLSACTLLRLLALLVQKYKYWHLSAGYFVYLSTTYPVGKKSDSSCCLLVYSKLLFFSYRRAHIQTLEQKKILLQLFFVGEDTQLWSASLFGFYIPPNIRAFFFIFFHLNWNLCWD